MSDRRTARRARTGLCTALGLAGLVAVSCSVGDDEPATVTLPRMNTTTSTMLAPEGPGTDPEQRDAPAIAWIVQLGSSGEDEFSAAAGVGDRIVAVGSSDGDLGGEGRGGVDAVVAVVRSDGEVVLVERTGSEAADAATAVAQADGSDVVVCGTTTGDLGATSGGASDLWCAPYERTLAPGARDADEAWQLGAATQLGGPDDEVVGALAYGPDGDLGYLVGSISGLMPGAMDPSGRGLGGGDALVLQVDGVGSPVWARQFGSPSAEAALGVAGNDDGDGITVGFTDGSLEGPSAGGRDAWISRFDRAGNQRWITQVGSDADDWFEAVTTLGEARRGTEQFVAVGATTGVLEGAGDGGSAQGGTDVMVASFGTEGGLQWIRQLGTDGDETAVAVVADGTNLYVAGTTSGGLGDLASDAEQDALGGPGGGSDGFLAALDATSGELLWVTRFGSEGDEVVTGATVTADGLVVLSGSTTGQLGEQLAGGGRDAFLVAFPLAAAGGGAASSV